jgi:hypothetical protein
MQTLTIDAATADSAAALYSALSAFRTELVEWEGRYRVEVSLGRSDREVVDVLNAIERFVNERHTGSARIKLNGHDYTLHEAQRAIHG